ncbi:MAG TPA: VWA domain-containing protein [Gammaproteobacteria bacterium]|nr:VWA domain-containing protein [Gammaproteobacteria bacterium]
MIHFAWPWMAVLAPLPWLLYRLRRAVEPQGATLFLPFAAGLGVPGAKAVGGGAGRSRILFGLIWLLLVGAAMRPQWLGDPVPVPTTGRRLLLAVDVSGSMAAQDMANGASRLQVVQQVAGHFIDQRHGDRVGLILFGSQPYLQAPLTSDLATVHEFLDEAVIGVAGTNTAIGDAIGLAIKRLRAQREADDASPQANPPQETVLILLTDGQSNAGAMPPLKAAQFAAQSGMRIYTIGVGAPPQQGFFGVTGNADLDETTLKAIAKATGGQYFRATDAAALQAVYREINKLEPAAGPKQWLRPATELFAWPLGLALLLSLPGAAWLGEYAWAA